jgi:hypothetical protein
MSKRELSRIEVLARLDGGRLTISAAAETLNLPSRDLNPAWTAAAARLRSPLRRARLLQRPPSDIFNFAQQKTSQLGCNTFRRRSRMTMAPYFPGLTWPWMEMTQRQPNSLAPWARPPSLIAVGGYAYGHAFGGCGGTCRSAPICPR